MVLDSSDSGAMVGGRVDGCVGLWRFPDGCVGEWKSGWIQWILEVPNGWLHSEDASSSAGPGWVGGKHKMAGKSLCRVTNRRGQPLGA